MPAQVLVDSGLLLALWDPEDGSHHAARQAVEARLAAGGRLVVLVSELSEVLVGAFRATPYAVRTIEEFVSELVREVRIVDRAIGRAAARLRAEHPGLRLGESLVVAAGDVGGAEEILTTNPRLVEVSPRVRLIGE